MCSFAFDIHTPTRRYLPISQASLLTVADFASPYFVAIAAVELGIAELVSETVLFDRLVVTEFRQLRK
jgi:hypothetical protein